jgi:carbamoyl-phosphate synthase (ammonia)
MFSFTRLRGSDPILGVEMASTGEVACFGANKEEAFLKSLLSTGFSMPKKNILLSVQSSLENDMTHSAYQLHELGYNLFATKATGEVLQKNGVPCTIVGYPTEKGKCDLTNALDMIREKDICMVVNVPTYESKRLEDNFLMRRSAVDFGIPLMTNMNLFKVFADAAHLHSKGEITGLNPKKLFEHYQNETDADAWTDKDEFH